MDYKIMNDRTVYELSEDGSATPIATVDDNGFVTGLTEYIDKKQSQEKPKRKGRGCLWFFIALFLIADIVLGYLYLHNSEELGALKGSYYTSLEEMYEIKTQNERMTKAYPLIINDIEIANIYKDGKTQTDFGERIYSSSTMFLAPKVFYTGLASGKKNLKIKWFTPNASLSTGIGSRDGFSFDEEEQIDLGDNVLFLQGWGGERMGQWGSGTYRVEIWFENSCLKSKTFDIY